MTDWRFSTLERKLAWKWVWGGEWESSRAEEARPGFLGWNLKCIGEPGLPVALEPRYRKF